MNMIAVTALETGVVILMSVVMTTHFHSVVSGSGNNRELFKNETRRKLRLRGQRLGIKTLINVRNDIVKTENELKDKIMYDYRNPIAAGYGRMPWNYVGGVGDIFFSDHQARVSSGSLIQDMTVRERRSAFHTRIEFPSDWTYWPNGLIVPDCYVDWKRLESLFRSPKAALAFMFQNKEKEAAEDALCAREFIMEMGEKELRRIAKELSLSMFGKEYVSKLSDSERIMVAQRMWAARNTYSVSALSRAVQINKQLLETILLPPG